MKRNENTIEKKNLKKKILMVTGLALLLGLVGYTGGSTYAKYVTTQETGSQVATVAKWGYTISANADELFSDAYKQGAHVDHDSAGVSVNADTEGDNLVAPGTKGSFKLQVKGTAEVASKLVVTVTNTSTIALTAPSTYEPVKWTVTDNNDNTKSKSDLSQADMLLYLDKLDAAYAPNDPCNIDLTISWEWKHFVDDATDILDTYLGDLIALNSAALAEKYPTNAPVGTTKLEFGVKVQVEQVA